MSIKSDDGYFGISPLVRTIGSGKDFSNISDAFSYAEKKIIPGLLKFSLDAGDYNEKIIDSHILPNLQMLLEGDTRGLVGYNYMNGEAILSDAANAGIGTCAITNNGNDITVTGSTANPNFANFASGDKILLYDNAGNLTEYTISSISGNVITLAVVAPAIGNYGTCFLLCPNRKIYQAGTNKIIDIPIDYMYNFILHIKGIRLDFDQLEAIKVYNCKVILENCLICGNDYLDTNAIHGQDNGKIVFLGKNNTIANINAYGLYIENAKAIASYISLIKTQGILCVNNAFLSADYTRVLHSRKQDNYACIQANYNSFIIVNNAIIYNNSYRGFFSLNKSSIVAENAKADNCGSGFYASTLAYIRAKNSISQNNTTGYSSNHKSYIHCIGYTVSGNTANFSPANDMTLGNSDSYINR